MALDAVWLKTIHYKVWIKGKWKGVVPSPTVVAIEKEAFGSPSITVADFTLFILSLLVLDGNTWNHLNSVQAKELSLI